MSTFGPAVELWLGDTLGWVDITGDVRLPVADNGGPIAISRGRRAESTQTDPGTATLVLDNLAGKYSPRNPSSPYYGLLGRNTPIRISLPDLPADRYLQLGGPQVITPDVAALDVTGDLDLRIDYAPDRANTLGEVVGLASKYVSTGTQRSWAWVITGDADGVYMGLFWSPDGTLASRRVASSSMFTLTAGQRVALRVTLDVDNGAGGVTATFYQAPTGAGPWTFISSTTQTGTSSIRADAAPLEVAAAFYVGATPLLGRLYGFEMRNGIGGTVVATPDMTAQEPDTTAWTDAAGRAWTITAGRFVDRRYRFVGEVSSWPPRWNIAESDRWVSIEAAGITRRLGQGAAPLLSPIRRHLTTLNPTAYLPLEDDSDTTIPTLVGSGADAVTVTGVTFGGGDDLDGAADTATLTAAGLVTARVTMAATTEWSGIVYVRMPSLPAADTRLLTVWTSSGAVQRFEAAVGPGGYAIRGYDSAGTSVFSTSSGFGTGGSPVDGWIALQLRAAQNGANTDVELKWHPVGTNGVFYVTSTSTANILGPVTRVQVEPAGVADTAVGHLTVIAGAVEFGSDLATASTGNAGETAGERMRRLSAEEGVPIAVVGDPSKTVTLGAQKVATYLDLMREAAEADLGILYEAREILGLEYRPRESLYNQVPLDLPYTRLAPPLEPVDDDQAVRNQITVSRLGGASAEAVQTDGPLSTQAPPDGVGVYTDSVQVNVAGDEQLPDQAGWRLRLGTVDEARYPRVTVQLAAPVWIADPDGTGQLASVETGDMLRLTGLPDWLPTSEALVLVQGYAESLDDFLWSLTFNGTPGSPWTAAEADGDARVAADDATLAAGVDADDLTLSLATTADNGLWTTDPADFPLDLMVGGEQVTVSGITGASSPQTATVTARAVNGVSRAWAAGTQVDVHQPAIVPL